MVIVDILQQQSWAICTDDEQNHIIYQLILTLNKTQNNLHQQVISLGQIVSRKKQIVPALERFYQG